MKASKPLKTLEKRLNGIQEVSGSIPLISTRGRSPETLEKSGASGLFLFLRALAKSPEKSSKIFSRYRTVAERF